MMADHDKLLGTKHYKWVHAGAGNDSCTPTPSCLDLTSVSRCTMPWTTDIQQEMVRQPAAVFHSKCSQLLLRVAEYSAPRPINPIQADPINPINPHQPDPT
jgi:hypothetical protein